MPKTNGGLDSSAFGSGTKNVYKTIKNLPNSRNVNNIDNNIIPYNGTSIHCKEKTANEFNRQPQKTNHSEEKIRKLPLGLKETFSNVEVLDAISYTISKWCYK